MKSKAQAIMARHIVALTDEEWMELVKAQLDLLTPQLMHSLTLQSIEDVELYWDYFGSRTIKKSKPEDGSLVIDGLPLDLRVICPESGRNVMAQRKFNYDDPDDKEEPTGLTQKTFGLSRDMKLVTIEILGNITKIAHMLTTPGGFYHRWTPKYVSIKPTRLDQSSLLDFTGFTAKDIWYGLSAAIKTLVQKREDNLEPLRNLRRRIEEVESVLAPSLLANKR